MRLFLVIPVYNCRGAIVATADAALRLSVKRRIRRNDRQGRYR